MGRGRHSRITEQQFFTLLRSGLNGEVPDVTLFGPNTGWEAIYNIAAEQTVVGNVTDGIDNLPQDYMPEPEELDIFLCDIFVIEQRNHQMNRFISKLFSMAGDEKVLLVKGQGVALYHKNPAQRQPGDIDLLMLPESYEKLKGKYIAKASKAEPEDPYILQAGMMFGSVEVEIHGSIRTLISPRLDKWLDDFIRDEFDNFKYDTVKLDSTVAKVPTPDFNAFYLFTHIVHHFWTGGVGLRQIVDWALMLNAEKDRIDIALLRRRLEETSLMNQWKVFAAFAKTRLGLEGLPFSDEVNEARVSRLSADIIRAGSFGINLKKPYSREGKSKIGWLLTSFHRLVIKQRLCKFPVFPVESLRYAFGALFHSFARRDRW